MKEIYVPRKALHIEVREKFHGHTKIELRDIRTGKVNRIEHDNTFTDGIESFMNPLGMMDYKFLYANATQKDRAAWKTMIGGIFLFDTAIPTSPMAKYMPAGTKMIANGSYGLSNAGNPTELGSFNDAESSESANSVSLVYDWGTSQGNGTIASVCLTTQNGGYIGYGNSGANYATQRSSIDGQYSNEYNLPNTNQSPSTPLFYDNKAYFAMPYSGGIAQGTSSVEVKYRHCSMTEFDVFEQTNGFDGNLPFSMTFNLTTATSGAYRATPAGSAYPTSILLLPYQLALPNGSSFVAYLLDVANGTVTEKTITNNTGQTININGVNGIMPIVFIDTTYAIIYCASDQKWYKINHTNSQVVGAATATDSIGSPDKLTLFGNMSDGLVAIDDRHIYDVSLNAIRTTNGSGMNGMSGYLSDIDATLFTYITSGYYRMKIMRNPLRLMTINNLDSAVTKTVDKTMKVTYTITRS